MHILNYLLSGEKKVDTISERVFFRDNTIRLLGKVSGETLCFFIVFCILFLSQFLRTKGNDVHLISMV